MTVKNITFSIACTVIALMFMPLNAGAVSYTTEGSKGKKSEETASPNKPKPGERTIHNQNKGIDKCTNADKILVKKVTKKSENMIRQITDTKEEFEKKGVPKDMGDFKKLRRTNEEIAEKRQYFRSAEYKTAQNAAKRCNATLPVYQEYESFWVPAKYNR